MQAHQVTMLGVRVRQTQGLLRGFPPGQEQRLILLLVPGACHIDTGLHFQSYQSYHNVIVSHKAQNYLIFLDLFRQFIKIQFQQHCTCVGWKHLISLMEKT